MRRRDEPVYGWVLIGCVTLGLILYALDSLERDQNWWGWLVMFSAAIIAFAAARSIYFDRIKK